METFNEKIKRIRKSLGLTQVNVCDKIGITQPSFASIESGKTTSITIDLGKKIAQALGVNFYELFEIESPGTNQNILQLIEENEQLKKTIANMKDDFIDLLSDNNLLLSVSAGLDYQTEEYFIRRAKHMEEMTKGNYSSIHEDSPYNKDNPESMREYISKNLKFGKRKLEK